MKPPQVLTAEVYGGASLLTPTRVLHHEAELDMKLATALSVRHVALGGFILWLKRRRYKQYLFSDALLVCRQSNVDGMFHRKALWPLHSLRVRPSRSSTINRVDSEEAMRPCAREGSKLVAGEKPETLFLSTGGLSYKCWARSEEEMNTVVAKVEALQGALPGAGRSLR